jgi:hypothetical protein
MRGQCFKRTITRLWISLPETMTRTLTGTRLIKR